MGNLQWPVLGKMKYLLLVLFSLVVACDQKTTSNEENNEYNSEGLSLSNLKNDHPTPEASVLALAAQHEELKSFTQAAATIKLAEILDREEGQFTVFAPTNAAFKAANIKVDSGSAAENERLKDIVLQHVISQHTASDNWIDKRTYTALNQGQITITVKDSVAYANGAKIIASDIQGVGGILHIIDKVMIPEKETTEIP